MNEEKSTIERIRNAIGQYERMKVCPENYETLRHFRQVFSALLWAFADETTKLIRQKGETDFQSKAQFERKKRELKTPENSMAQAENLAKIEIEGLLNAEQIAEAECKAAMLLLSHAENVYKSMMQDLSYLRGERHDAFANASQTT